MPRRNNNRFAAFVDEEPISQKSVRPRTLAEMMATDPFLVAMNDGGVCWGDIEYVNKKLPVAAQIAQLRLWAAEEKVWQANIAASRAARLARIAEPMEESDPEPTAEEKAASYAAQVEAAAKQEKWDAVRRHYLETCPLGEFDDDTASIGSHGIHLDENGEPEECRFFNSPAGCRNGASCPYKHKKRALSEIQCRFMGTDRGCRSGFGKKCPYKH